MFEAAAESSSLAKNSRALPRIEEQKESIYQSGALPPENYNKTIESQEDEAPR
jgi:hypothetical protein